MFKFPEYVQDVEARIAHRLIALALKNGFVVSVYDGEEWALKRSNHQATIEAECFATDETTLKIRDAETDISIGNVVLILGNGEDVISDHSDNEAMNHFMAQYEQEVKFANMK